MANFLDLMRELGLDARPSPLPPAAPTPVADSLQLSFLAENRLPRQRNPAKVTPRDSFRKDLQGNRIRLSSEGTALAEELGSQTVWETAREKS